MKNFLGAAAVGTRWTDVGAGHLPVAPGPHVIDMHVMGSTSVRSVADFLDGVA